MESASTSSTVSNGSGGGARVPAPMPAVNGPPPFLVKTYEMVDDSSTDKIVSWSLTDNSFVVWDSAEFAKDLLPKYFKHNNFSSFVRQLNTYGFRKVNPDRWEFANEGFLRGQKHLLKNITRRKPVHENTQQPQQPNGQSSTINACVEVGKFGLEEEVERLKRDKNVLMQELVRLRQQQQTTDGQLSAMVQRLQGMEQRQQQMMSFLAKAVNSPGFLAQFMPQPNDSGRRLAEGSKKRRLKQDNVSHDIPVGPTDGQIIKYQPLMNEAAKAMLSQIIKLGSSSGMENFQNASENGFLIGDGSSESIAMDCGSSSNRVSGVTLQEVPPACGPPFLTSGAAFSEVQSPFLDAASADIATNVPVSPPDTIIMPELSGMVPETNVVGIMGSGTDNGIFLDPSGEIPLELSEISPDRDMEWDNSLLDDIIPELPEVGDPFWEKFLKSPTRVETEMDSIETDELRDGTETKPLENGWEKSQHVAELTEQMGHLSSDTKKV